jgi:hypothetical protein
LNTAQDENKTNLFSRTYLQAENKSRNVQINLLNHEKYILKDPKNSEENSGDNLGYEESK